MDLAAYLPLIVAAVAFIVYCLVELAREQEPVRYFPKWFWAVLIVFWIPFEAVGFLMFGRSHDRPRALLRKQ